MNPSSSVSSPGSKKMLDTPSMPQAARKLANPVAEPWLRAIHSGRPSGCHLPEPQLSSMCRNPHAAITFSMRSCCSRRTGAHALTA